MLLNKGSSQTKSIKNISLSTFSITHECFMLLNKGSSQTKSINDTSHYPHIRLNKGSSQTKLNKHPIIKKMKQSNQINKQTTHYPHIR